MITSHHINIDNNGDQERYTLWTVVDRSIAETPAAQRDHLNMVFSQIKNFQEAFPSLYLMFDRVAEVYTSDANLAKTNSAIISTSFYPVPWKVTGGEVCFLKGAESVAND